MASPEKRCLYEVLGLSQNCNPDEIRSAYKKLALQRHPDKLIQSGVPEAEATALFQELVNAYEVLSDPRERSWYDSNRSKILFSSSNSGPNNSSKFGSVPNLFSFFSNSVYSGFSDTGKGFYKVYGDLFDKVYQNEVNFAKTLGLSSPKEAPLMGNSNSPYAQVTAFYNYWLGFTTVMDFCWVDQYDAMAGMNRKSRRVMEDENKKLRKKARREFNETVRGLAEFVKKRDKRVIDMQVKRNEELERKREEEQARRKELERLKAERAKTYEEPDWTQVEDLEDEAEETSEEDHMKDEENELYCVACGKKFKSDKQWKNHEQSKKHKEKVAALREAFSDEDKEFEEIDVSRREEEEQEADGSGYFTATDDVVDELGKQFQGSFGGQGKSYDDEEEVETTGKDGHASDGHDSNGTTGELGSDDDEANILEAMVSGLKNKKNVGLNRATQTLKKKVETIWKDGNASDGHDSNGTTGELGSDDDEASILEAMVSGLKNKKYVVPNFSTQTLKKKVEMENDTNLETTEKAGYTSDDQDSRGAAGESVPDDYEASILEAMVSGLKSKKNTVSNWSTQTSKTKFEMENDDNEMDFMEYNNTKGSGRNRGSRKQRDRRAEEGMRSNETETNGEAEKNTQHDGSLDSQTSLSQFSPKTNTNGKEDDSSEKIEKIPKQAVDERGNTKKDNKTKSKNASKGRKKKTTTTSRDSSNTCEKCGEEFESRNKLHKHLGETGHAALKSR